MVQVFNMPIATALKNDGSVGVGYKLYFYTTGTTTKKTVYSDEALTTPLTNPVVADANGRFVQIFLEGTGQDYKAILGTDTETDPPTSPIWTVDPVDSFSFDANSFDPRPMQHWGTTAGTAGAYTITPTDAITAYDDDIIFSVQAHITNTAGPTLNASGVGAINLIKEDNAGGTTALEAGDMQGGGTYNIRIDSSSARLLNPGKPYIDIRNVDFASKAEAELRTDTTKALNSNSIANIGAWTVIEEKTVSAVATVDFVTGIDSTYKKYVIEIIGLVPVTDDVLLYCLYSQNAGGAWIAANYRFNNEGFDSTSTAYGYHASAQAFIALTDDDATNKISNAAGESYSGVFRFYNLASTTLTKKMEGSCTYDSAGGNLVGLNNSGDYTANTAAVNGLRFILSSGNIASAIVKLYGIR